MGEHRQVIDIKFQ